MVPTSRYLFNDGDDCVFVGADLSAIEKERLVKACRRICLERGRRTDEELRQYLITRLDFLNRVGKVYSFRLPSPLDEITKDKFTNQYLTPASYGMDAFFVFPAKTVKGLQRPPLVAIPVMWPEIEPRKIQTR
jgi:hypothetical protein